MRIFDLFSSKFEENERVYLVRVGVPVQPAHINAEVWIKLVQIDEFGFGVYFCGPGHKQKIPKSLDFRILL